MKDALKYGLPWVLFTALLILSQKIFSDNVNDMLMVTLFGLLVIYYFLLDNFHVLWSKQTVIAFALWLISIQLRNEYYGTIANWVPALMAALLVFVYFQRFQTREEKHWVDYLKLVGVIALLPATYFESPLTALIATLLAFIYLLDRLIIRKQMNKTTQIITFCLLGLISISFLIYSFIKADEAEKARMEAEAQRNEVVRLMKKSEALQKEAEAAASEARKQAALAAKALEDCKSSK
ncbi:hypothetical protein [Ekhidna sp.]|jgi:uncharacterized membrane protein|uniref:hypothetical protein n=1 Tax=Ekhidna sp. TaxID=2608089 RepID=UPI0032ECD91F